MWGYGDMEIVACLCTVFGVGLENPQGWRVHDALRRRHSVKASDDGFPQGRGICLAVVLDIVLICRIHVYDEFK